MRRALALAPAVPGLSTLPALAKALILNQRSRRRLRHALVVVVLLLAVVGALLLATVGCMVVTALPPPTSVRQRLDMFPTDGLPLAGAVTVHWDRHMIPFIEAETDADLAFVLGMVHAHLRLGQMELMRHVSQGRLAELFGPPVAEPWSM